MLSHLCVTVKNVWSIQLVSGSSLYLSCNKLPFIYCHGSRVLASGTWLLSWNVYSTFISYKHSLIITADQDEGVFECESPDCFKLNKSIILFVFWQKNPTSTQFCVFKKQLYIILNKIQFLLSKKVKKKFCLPSLRVKTCKRWPNVVSVCAQVAACPVSFLVNQIHAGWTSRCCMMLCVCVFFNFVKQNEDSDMAVVSLVQVQTQSPY